MEKSNIKKLVLLVLCIGLVTFIAFEIVGKSFNSKENEQSVVSRRAAVNKDSQSNIKDSRDNLMKGEVNKKNTLIDNIEEYAAVEVGKFKIEKGIETEITEILKELNTMTMGVSPWRIIYASKNKVLFYNYSHLLAYGKNKNTVGIYAALDLRKLETGYMQGSEIIEFNPCPNGEYIIISTGTAEKGKKKKMYFCGLENNTVKVLSQENYFDLIDGWSHSSKYYAFADKTGERIIIYNSLSGNMQKIAFNKGTIKNIFISDSGDILISGDKKYLVKKEEKYMSRELNISGTLLAYKGEDIIYYDSGNIYKYCFGKTDKLQNVGAQFKLVKNNGNRSVFSDENSTVVYSHNDNMLYNYSSKYESMEYALFSPDLQKCTYLDDRGNVKIIGRDNKIYNITDNKLLTYLGNYKWFDNENIIRIEQALNDGAKLGHFSIKKINIKTGETTTIYKNK